MDQDLGRRRGEGEKVSLELSDDSLRYGLVEVLGWLLVMAFLTREGWEV